MNGKFGWSYPPGAAEDPHAPYNQDDVEETGENPASDLIATEADVLMWLSAESREQAERHLYKFTDCGAWILWHDDGIQLGSIVEGSDAEVITDSLRYPFTERQLQETIDYIEAEADMLWREANEGEDE